MWYQGLVECLGAFVRSANKGVYPLGQRAIAFLLLVLVSFLIADPLWELHDHLDNLRHLGPHGALLILLMVAVAGVLLLKAPRWLLLSVSTLVAGVVTYSVVVCPRSADFCSPALVESGPPLRI